MVGQAFNFDGIDDYFQAATNGLPSGGADRTIELWAKVDVFEAGEEFFAGYVPSQGQTYHLGTEEYQHRVFVSTWGPALAGPVLEPGLWYHVSATTTGSNTTLYLNGVPVANGDLGVNTPSGAPFYIGRIPDDAFRTLKGQVDEVSVYGRALSAAEIQGIANAGSAGKCKTPPTPYIQSSVLSPLTGDADVTHSLGACPDSRRWCFEQHRTPPLHAVGGGLCASDDTYAWDSHPFPDASESVPVYAVASGKVAATYGGCTNAGGDWGEVLVEHGSAPNLWWTGYLHMRDIQVTPNATVTANTVLGYISNVATTPMPNHLHFVIYHGTNTQGELISNDAAIMRRLAQSPLTSPAYAGTNILEIADTSGYSLADAIVINPGSSNEERKTVTGISSLILDSPLQFNHEVGEPVVAISAPQAVGGIAEYPQLQPDSATAVHHSSTTNAVALAGLAAGGALLLTAGGWYARRRWLK
jgi:hypothetical protein